MKLILTVFLLFSNVLLFSQINQGLVAKYSFNAGNANDEVGNNNGTVYGAVLAMDRFGNPNGAYYFDGIDDYIDIGSDMTIKPTVGSVSLWVSLYSISQTGWGYAYNPLILAKNTSNSGSYMEGYCLYLVMSDHTVITIQTDYPTYNQKFFFSNTAISPPDWNHLVVTFDNDSIWLYVNGQLENKMYKGFVSTYDPSEPVYVGKSHAIVNERFFNGLMDDIRIYKRVLSPLEVDSLFHETNIPLGLQDENNHKDNFIVWNDPNSGALNFSGKSDLVVTDVSGKIILSKNGVSTLDLSDLSRGVYFVLFNKDGVIFRRVKFIVD